MHSRWGLLLVLAHAALRGMLFTMVFVQASTIICECLYIFFTTWLTVSCSLQVAINTGGVTNGSHESATTRHQAIKLYMRALARREIGTCVFI